MKKYNGVKLTYVAKNGTACDVKTAEVMIPTFDETDSFIDDCKNNSNQDWFKNYIYEQLGDEVVDDVSIALIPVKH
jgi:hypothetical protein